MATPNDIERLANRLRELLGDQLLPEEKELLDSILDVAWEALQLSARDRFIQSYDPGEDGPPPPAFHIGI